MNALSPNREAEGTPKVLVLSGEYADDAGDFPGLWVKRLVDHSTRFCEPKVVAPIPCRLPFGGLRRGQRRDGGISDSRGAGVEVFHPRFVLGPGGLRHAVEWATYSMAVGRTVARLRRVFPFELIHAYSTYPDGCVAVRLGRRYHVPVIISDRTRWGRWMDDSPMVCRQSVRAVRECTFHIAVSGAFRESIACYAGESEKSRVISDGVDGTVFALREDPRQPIANQILCVAAAGNAESVGGVLHAMRLLADAGQDTELVLAGQDFCNGERRDSGWLRQMASELALEGRVRFVGEQPVAELVRFMQESALLVLPGAAEGCRIGASRMVLLAALACGTPVVATRSGAEDIVNDQVGVLVAPGDPGELARGVKRVLARRADYDPGKLRAYSLDNFGLKVVGPRISDLYAEALDRCHWRTSSVAERTRGGESPFAQANMEGDGEDNRVPSGGVAGMSTRSLSE